MMAHQDFGAAGRDISRGESAAAQAGRSADFAVLLATAAARQLFRPASGNSAIGAEFQNASPHYQSAGAPQDAAAIDYHQMTIKALGVAPVAFSKDSFLRGDASQRESHQISAAALPANFPHRFSNLVLGKARASSSFGNEPKPPVYHGVSINVQTLGVNRDDQSAHTESCASDLRMLRI